jgi:hypothetical protein
MISHLAAAATTPPPPSPSPTRNSNIPRKPCRTRLHCVTARMASAPAKDDIELVEEVCRQPRPRLVQLTLFCVSG